ncbi:MAG: hypothetical protein Q9170_000827 [Blastenia crenularia]
MAFRTEDDPYPLSLPKMDSPDMNLYRQPSTASAKHSFVQEYPGYHTNGFDSFDADQLFSDTIQLLPKEYGTTVHPADLSLDTFQSPQSSASSTSSPGQHKRHASSNSSTFDFESIVPDEAQMQDVRLKRSSANVEPPKRPLDTMTAENDVDRQMNELFDFDSAANSPGDSLSTEISNDKPITAIAMPYKEQTVHASGRPTLQPRNHKRPATSRSVASTPSSFKPESSWEYPSTQSRPFDNHGNTVFRDNLPYGPLYNTPAAPVLAANAGFVGPNHFGYPQSAFVPPTAMFHGTNHREQQISPRLLIHPIPPKTRVETQIPITVTLVPAPSGITRLHLPSRTMAKPKLLAKQKHSKSPDMLELDVMPVCASAMKKPGVYPRALAIARGQKPFRNTSQQEQQPSLEGLNAAGNTQERIDPMDGGPISICDGCMMRERKRANRRMEKEVSDEDLRWKQGEKERIVVFNENEIVDWKPYGSPDLNESASKRARVSGKGKKKDETGDEMASTNSQPTLNVPYPELAKQVRLLMRITCYCRHQGESEGFQVILTLRDYLGNCIAQEVSTPILITDDHKTSALQSESRPAMIGNESQLHNGGFFPNLPTSHIGIANQMYNMGQSRSTIELPFSQLNFNASTPHRSATSVSLQQHGQAPGSRSTGFSTPSQSSSYRTSSTLTPHNLSRHVSPSATSGPTPKRRKASGTEGMNHRPLVDLSMTRMQTEAVPMNRRQSPSASPTSSSEASEGLAMGKSKIWPCPLNLVVTRTTASTNLSGQTSAQNRLAGNDAFNFLPNPSPPPSAHLSDSDPMADVTTSQPSARQSPQPVPPQPHTEMAAHAQALHHSLLHVPGAVGTTAGAPRLVRIIPSEGPKSGGIDVTVLGEGFHNDLNVLFADAVATRTTVLNSQTMICMIPPSYQAGLVRVSLRGRHQPDPQIWFQYIDTDEQDLMRLALAVMHHRNTGKLASATDIARSIIGGQQPQNSQQISNGIHHSQRSRFDAMDLELSILGVIDVIDQTDSAITPRYSLRQANGQTMLHLAASLGYHRLVAGLLARGMNPDLRDRNGISALHMACFHGHTNVVRKLLSAGGDPNICSLLGLAPVDMATTPAAYQLMCSIPRHTRSKSAGATPVSYLSRVNSVASIHSTWGVPLRDQTPTDDANASFNNNNTLIEAYQSRPTTPAEVWTRSRRSSASHNQNYLPIQTMEDPASNTHLVAAAAAMAAWRDNLAIQIHHFQQNVQRTLPNLQLPNLPPLPTFEAYQGHPMVRRISSLVPRMTSPPAPPAYDEIYPEPTPKDTDVKKASTARAVGDALIDAKCATNFDRTRVDTSALGRTMDEGSTIEQIEKLRLARVGKVKTLSNDRKLFFVWSRHIERIKQRNQEWPLVLPPRSQPFSHAILAPKYLVIVRKILHRMPDIQHQRVGKHEQSIEDVQWPLVSFEVPAIPLPDVNNAKDVTARDDDAANVHQVQNAPSLVLLFVRFARGFGGKNAGSLASTVEDGF